MRIWFLTAALSVIFLALAIRSGAQTSVRPDTLQAKFDQEPDLVRRAKMLPELSRIEFKTIGDQVAAGNDTDALRTLRQLVDNEQKCSDALDAKVKSPESHAAGFKQLQIATRESLRRLDDLTVSMVSDEQEPFLAIRQDLDRLNRHLIRELFPHQPQPPESAPEENP